MATPIRCLVGLGNPSSTYQNTRHNIGILWLRALAARFDITLRLDRERRVEVGRGILLGHDVRLLVPTTFMNQSGAAVGPYLRYFRIDPDEMLVAFDDVSFEVGTTRLKMGGGAGGHNGLRSLIMHLQGNREFGRLRIGVGHPGDPRRMVAYLTQTTLCEDERSEMLDGSHLSNEILGWLFKGDWQRAMTAVNSHKLANQ